MKRRVAGRPWSMTLRLTVLYAASALTILVVAGWVQEWGLQRNLRVEDARFVQAKIQELSEIARRYPDRLDMLENELAFESTHPRFQPYFVRVRGPSGATELQSPGMPPVLSPARFPPSGGKEPVSWRDPAGLSYLLMSAALPPGGRRDLQVALDVTRDTGVIDRYRGMLATVVLLGGVLSAIVGYFVTRRGLQPIAHITAAATKVSAEHLDRRIGGGRWPAELLELAAVFDGMLDRLDASFRRLSSFSADLAHEMRTPLTNLRGEAEVALGRARSAEEYRAVLESALEEYARLTGMIDRMLFLARADAGAAALERRRLDARAEIDTICDYYAPLAEEAGVALVVAGGGEIEADPLLFRRAVGNLVANAVEHTPAGGRVGIDVESDGRELCVRVADTGTGIAPEHLPRIFDRFYQVDPARARQRAGAGLGLALVRSIAEMHGGQVAAESRVGEGTTITLRFPSSAGLERTPPMPG